MSGLRRCLIYQEDNSNASWPLHESVLALTMCASLGTVSHIHRENILERNLRIPRALYRNEENTKAIIMVRKYIYTNKSSNFLFQRQSYSLHKFQNLLKPFFIVTSDGYILDVKGP